MGYAFEIHLKKQLDTLQDFVTAFNKGCVRNDLTSLCKAVKDFMSFNESLLKRLLDDDNEVFTMLYIGDDSETSKLEMRMYLLLARHYCTEFCESLEEHNQMVEGLKRASCISDSLKAIYAYDSQKTFKRVEALLDFIDRYRMVRPEITEEDAVLWSFD